MPKKMNPVQTCFKEIERDQSQLFTLNFVKENEIKNDFFHGQSKYSISSFVKKRRCEDFVK